MTVLYFDEISMLSILILLLLFIFQILNFPIRVNMQYTDLLNNPYSAP